MKSRRLAAVLMLLLIGMSCFLSAPVLSGEHPWDVDRTGGGGGSSPAPTVDSTRVTHDDGTASYQGTRPAHGFTSWYGVVGRLTVYFAVQHSTTRSYGSTTKGNAER